MTRPIVHGSGLPGVSQQVFGDQAKEMGRTFVLDGEATILRHTPAQDAGGAPNDTWVPDDDPVMAHREPTSLGEKAGAQISADQINEEISHTIYLHPDDGESVTEQDRFEMDGTTWVIRAKLTWNNPETIPFQVKEKPA